jgi:peptidoglycan-associated lipoprotein
MPRPHPAVLALVTSLVASCAATPAPPPRVDARAGAANATPVPALTQKPDASATRSSVVIEERILRACGDIPSAHFAFDSSQIQPDAASALDALGRCFGAGPLAGKSLRLVGHADPRGETEYNLGLGQRRAGSLGAYLTTHGISPSHLTMTSRGAFDATGTDEEGWARDRRVDVLLVD